MLKETREPDIQNFQISSEITLLVLRISPAFQKIITDYQPTFNGLPRNPKVGCFDVDSNYRSTSFQTYPPSSGNAVRFSEHAS